MGAVDDYVRSLEGKENIDPVVVASTMLELHNNEMETASNKIASLEQTITTKDSEFTTLSTELRDQKAKNWDLVNRVPAESDEDNGTPVTDPRDATYDQFFED